MNSIFKSPWFYLIFQTIIFFLFPYLTIVTSNGPLAILNLLIITPLSLAFLSFVNARYRGFSWLFFCTEIVIFLLSIPVFYFSWDLLNYGIVYLVISIISMYFGTRLKKGK